MDVYVCMGIDKTWRSTGILWTDSEREVFQTHLQNEWEILKMPATNLMVEWIDYMSNSYFKMSVSSLTRYQQLGKLDREWFNYLVMGSGSCIEYAQFATVYDIITSHYEISHEDLMLRTRTDIMLRHALCLDNFNPSGVSTTVQIFQSLFPSSSNHLLQWEEKGGREASYYPPSFQPQKWVVTLRKNLVYIMPLSAGKYICQVSRQYGDWDALDSNHYWFNAESQFRGCLRHHGFTIWEYNQTKDECVDDFESLKDEFPIYAIYR